MASFFPTLRGECVMLDLGANVQCDATNLVQFAIMGNVFARSVLGILHPSIAILNVGSEDQKGHEYLREAAAILRTMPLPGRFHGFVEGDDIAKGKVDVVVSDGFTEIGRASCRERVCQSVSISVRAVPLNKKIYRTINELLKQKKNQ